MAARGRSNPLALAVLALLSERPMHPYEMSTVLRERRKQESIKLNFGSLYSVVDSLHRRKLIEARETVRDGRRPERTVYAITDAGTAEMVDWLSDLVAYPVKEYPQFEAALSLLPMLAVDEAVTLLETRLRNQLIAEQQAVAVLRQAGELGFPRLFQIEHEYELALLRAEIGYIRQLIDDIRAEAITGVPAWRRLHELRAAGHPPEEIETRLAAEFQEVTDWFDRIEQNAAK